MSLPESIQGMNDLSGYSEKRRKKMQKDYEHWYRCSGPAAEGQKMPENELLKRVSVARYFGVLVNLVMPIPINPHIDEQNQQDRVRQNIQIEKAYETLLLKLEKAGIEPNEEWIEQIRIETMKAVSQKMLDQMKRRLDRAIADFGKPRPLWEQQMIEEHRGTESELREKIFNEKKKRTMAEIDGIIDRAYARALAIYNAKLENLDPIYDSLLREEAFDEYMENIRKFAEEEEFGVNGGATE